MEESVKTQSVGVMDRLMSQPHQPFFILGVVNAIMTMALFWYAERYGLSMDMKLFHSYGMIFAVFTNFFYGFLYTTFSRFSMRPPVEKRVYTRLFAINIISSISLYLYPLSHDFIYLAILANGISISYTIKIFYSIYSEAPEPKSDQYMIILSLGMAFLSNLLYLLSLFGCDGCNEAIFSHYAVGVGIYLYLLNLSITVGWRMIPFFSGCHFYAKSSYFHHIVTILLISHVALSTLYPKALFAVDMALAVLFLYELYRMDLPFPNKTPLLWSLHIALFWIPLAFFASSFAEFSEAWFGFDYIAVDIHLLMLGFLTTVMISFGTRVTLGHGGAPLMVGKAGTALLMLVQLPALGRFLYSMHSGDIFLDISASLWIAVYLIWIALYGKILIFGYKG